MKLEACSYNASNMSPTFSLATVVATSGARILLHFDGADSKSDIWRLPDSGDIHPVGWTEGSLLKAPLGTGDNSVTCFVFSTCLKKYFKKHHLTQLLTVFFDQLNNYKYLPSLHNSHLYNPSDLFISLRRPFMFMLVLLSYIKSCIYQNFKYKYNF